MPRIRNNWRMQTWHIFKNFSLHKTTPSVSLQILTPLLWPPNVTVTNLLEMYIYWMGIWQVLLTFIHSSLFIHHYAPYLSTLDLLMTLFLCATSSCLWLLSVKGAIQEDEAQARIEFSTQAGQKALLLFWLKWVLICA